MPANYGGGNFIADREAEQGGMSGNRTSRGAYEASDGTHASLVVEKRNVLFPGNANHNPQSILASGIE
jgi:hypothetical protein